MTDLTWFLFITFLFDVSAQALRPLVSLQMSALGSTPGEIGLLFAASQVLPLIFGMPLGRLSDRIGPVRVIGVGSAIACLSYLGMALAPTSLGLAAGQALMWIGISSVAVAQQVMIAGMGAPHQREQNYGLLGSVLAFDQLAGPAVGGILADMLGIRHVFFLATAAGCLPLLAFRRLSRIEHAGDRPLTTPAAGGNPWLNGLRLLAGGPMRMIFLVVFLAILAFDVRISFLPVYLDSLGYSKSSIGLMFSVLAGAAIIVRAFTGYLTQRLGSWRLLAIALAIAVPALILLPYAGHTATVVAGVLVLGIAFGLTQPLTMSITVGAVAPAVRGLALGIRMSGQNLSMLVSPLVLGALAANFGLGAALQGAGALALLASGAAVYGARGAAALARRKE